MVEEINYDLSELEAIADKIIALFQHSPILLIEGTLGAGKTTLIKQICKQLGITSPLSSPSFSIVNEYETADHKTIYHFDLYRIKSLSEALDFGIEEYIFSNQICLIEWPEMIADYWQSVDFSKIKIEILPNNSRKISIFS